MPIIRTTLALSLAAALAASLCAAQQPPPATAVEGLDYTLDFFPEADYDPALPTPGELLGFPLGKRPAAPEEIERCLETWERASPRVRVFRYAESFEGRGLYYVALGSPERLARLEEIREGLARLADPRGLSQAEAEGLLDSLPAVAWLAYSIHGNESSGSDAALAVIHHLAADRSDETAALLGEVLVLIDPMMNPDGRARFVKSLAEHRGTTPSVDDQSLLHSGYWPWGRTNHYYFDLNRDWLLGVNPESRGRIRAAGEWHPLLFVDAHEMGSQDTYLFSPQRDPRNPHVPERREHWNALFARDQAAAFDRYSWPYYTGEWNEGWYPGYSDAWAGFRGAVGILYEQASVDEDGVRRAGGAILTYREAVHHQAVSSLANLETLRRQAGELRREFLAERREAVSADGPYAGRTFAVLPTANRGRLRRFVDLMELQGVELHRLPRELEAGPGVDQLGRGFRRRRLPAGTLLIPNRQPEARLVATMLEFDTPMPQDYLDRERKELVRRGRSTIYDLTAWNLTMLYGLEALTLEQGLPDGAEPWSGWEEREALSGEGAEVAWIIDGADDRSVAAAARLMERGVEVRVADRELELSGARFARGSVVVTRDDNRDLSAALAAEVRRAAAELDLEARAVTTGLGEGELPDLGGGHFHRLEPPRIALVARGGISAYDFGTLWFELDQRFGLRHSQLSEDGLSFSDLRRYNVLVLPDRWFGSLPEAARSEIKTWVEAGGTLIAIGDNAAAVASEEAGLSTVRRLEDVLEKLDEHELAVLREWMVRRGDHPAREEVWTFVPAPELESPWDALGELERPAAEELKRRDAWQRLFMPRGALLAARADPEHWLTFGTGEWLPVLTRSQPVLMAAGAVEAPVRFGVLSEAASSRSPSRIGWAAHPAGYELRLRMSGLLWPEAAHRIAHSAWVTRERLGSGQIILFAGPPSFRASTPATARILTNAMIYGPGLGASHPIRP